MTRKWAFDALPALGSVARVGGSSVYTPAVDPDGYLPSIIICCGTPRVKIFNSVSSPPSRRTGLREAGRGVGMGPTKIGRGSRTSWVHLIAKPVGSAAGEVCQKYELAGLPGSSGTYPFLCMRLGMTHGRPSRAFAPRQRRLDARGQNESRRRAKIESPGVLAVDLRNWSAGSGSHRRRGYELDCPWTAPEAPRTPEGPRAARNGNRAH